MKRFVIVFLLLNFSFISWSQYSLVGAVYFQNFDGLGTGDSSPTGGNLSLVNASLNGWFFSETLANADVTITAGTGSSNTGDTYNFGSTAAVDRTLGGLRSGNLNPTFGFYFTNNTGSTITDLAISFAGEQWRLGAMGRTDRIDFEYSANATSLTSGAWISFDALDFTAPVMTGTVGALNGNLPANKTAITATLSGINIANGASFFIRWTDFDPTGADDGLGVDDFSFTASSTPPSTDYFQTIASGEWTSLSTWQSSPDNSTWVAATSIPTSTANNITIRNGHTVSFGAFITVDQVTIESGGILDYANGVLTVIDGSGNDISINNGGIFALSLASTPPAFTGANPTVSINTGGILRVSAGGLTGAGTGVNANNFVYQHQSILEYTLNGGFGTDNVTYFPNVDAVTIPIFKVTSNATPMLVGSSNPTTFKGIFEANGTGGIIWQNTGNKVFRNGIRGTDTISANASAANAKFIINGSTAELEGIGGLIVPTTGGLEIGSAGGTLVTLVSNKTVTGNVSLISTNTFVELGSNNLTVTGTISGGGANAYIRTNGTGALTLNTVDVAGKTFPVGHSVYNPLLIAIGSNHNWTVKVTDGVTADSPYGTILGAVLLTWDITPSTNPPAGGASLTFQFDRSTQVGAQFDVPPNNTPDIVAAWNRKTGYWQLAGTSAPLVNVGGSLWTATISNVSTFSPFGLTRTLLPLPIRLIDFNAVKASGGSSSINWELAACCSAAARFEIQRADNNRNFITIGTTGGSATNRFYTYTDNGLKTGINYYRLKMTDADGTVTYSRTVAIMNGVDGLLLTSLFPTIVGSMATLTVTSSKEQKLDIIIVDMQGRVVRRQNHLTAAGNNSITIEAGNLAAGMYQLYGISEGEKTNVIRFLKQ